MTRRSATLVDTTEHIVKTAARQGADSITLMKQAIGERRYKERRLKRKEKAMQRVGAWWVFGQAAPFDHKGNELGRAYWRRIRDAFGPTGVERWDQECYELWLDFSPEWQLEMPEELQDYYEVLLLTGLHSGDLLQPMEKRKREAPRG